ncbi:TPA: integrase [Streptococcus agalactiae]|nr:integrase [Streptococcus agalactiae]HEO2522676.1 integrase [Streptococcus agalactiae]
MAYFRKRDNGWEYRISYKLIIGNILLCNITSTKYQQVINHYSQTHVQDTVKRFNIHVKACVSMAVHEGYIEKNFCLFTKVKAKNKGRK